MAGLIIIIAAGLLLNVNSIFPGYNALFPVVGTIVLLRSAPFTSIVKRTLSFQPLVFTGKISYSLYLWHLPVLGFSEYFIYDTFQSIHIIIPFCITFLLAILSWRYVEQPFRLKKEHGANPPKTYGYAFIALFTLTGFCLIVNWQDGFPGRSHYNQLLEEIRVESNTSEKQIMPYYTYFINADTIRSRLPTIGMEQGVPEFILWGDSHAGKLLPVFETICKGKQITGYAAIATHSPPVLTHRTDYKNARTASNNAAVFHFITTHPEIKKVFLAARWTVHRNLCLERVKKPIFDEELRLTIDSLTKTGREVILFTPQPELKTIPKKYYFQTILLQKDINSLTPSRDEYFEDHKEMLAILAKLDRLPHVQVIATYDFFFRNNKILLADQGHLLYIDRHHLSRAGSAKLQDLIANKLR